MKLQRQHIIIGGLIVLLVVSIFIYFNISSMEAIIEEVISVEAVIKETLDASNEEVIYFNDTSCMDIDNDTLIKFLGIDYLSIGLNDKERKLFFYNCDESKLCGQLYCDFIESYVCYNNLEVLEYCGCKIPRQCHIKPINCELENYNNKYYCMGI